MNWPVRAKINRIIDAVKIALKATRLDSDGERCVVNDIYTGKEPNGFVIVNMETKHKSANSKIELCIIFTTL